MAVQPQVCARAKARTGVGLRARDRARISLDSRLKHGSCPYELAFVLANKLVEEPPEVLVMGGGWTVSGE